MLVVTTSTAILLYAVVAAIFLIFAAEDANVDEKHCHAWYPVDVEGDKPAEACFVLNDELELAQHQAWLGSAENFTRFHRQPPSAICEPEHPVDYTLKLVEASYRLGRTTDLGYLNCPKAAFCLVEARFNGGWKINVQSFPAQRDAQGDAQGDHPPRLRERAALVATMYRLVVGGPARGPLSFVAINYSANHTLVDKLTEHNLYPRVATRTRSCPVVLERGIPDGIPDGILSFVPAPKA